MAFTVTGSATGTEVSDQGFTLRVQVLTAAIESGGASAANGLISAAPATVSVTPAASHSWIAFVGYQGEDAAQSPAANCTAIDNVGDYSGTDSNVLNGYYSGTVTAGTAVHPGFATNPDASAGVCAYEIRPSGAGTPAMDASTPAFVMTGSAGSCTTAAFTPPAGSVLVAMMTVRNLGGGGTDTYSVTDTSGLGLTWTSRAAITSSSDWTVAIFTATLPAAAVSVPPPLLIPPGPFSPMAFQRQARPSGAPQLAPGQDAGSGADTAAIQVSDTDTGSGADSASIAVSDTDAGAGADTAAIGISDTDTGSGADSAAITVSGSDTGSGSESSLEGPLVRSYPVIPPGRQSPMAFRYQAWPTQAFPEIPSGDTGAGAEGGTVSVSDTDAGSGAETSTITATVPDSDSGSGADSGSVTALGAPGPPAALLIPPGFQSPLAWQRQAWPSQAPLLTADRDAGSGAEAGTVQVSDTDTGTGADTAQVRVSDTDAGSAADAGSATALVTPPVAPLIPPGFASPMAFRTLTAQIPSPLAVQVTQITDTDTGSGAESATAAAVPVTGTGIIQRLNAVRDTEAGRNITLYMSQALGAVLRFLNTGSERLYVLAEYPGVTVSVGLESLVDDEAVAQFGPVTLAAGDLYSFGPFHSVLQVPGTSAVQVTLSTTSGVQVLVVQGAR